MQCATQAHKVPDRLTVTPKSVLAVLQLCAKVLVQDAAHRVAMNPDAMDPIIKRLKDSLSFQETVRVSTFASATSQSTYRRIGHFL